MIADPNKKPHTKLTSEEQYSHTVTFLKNDLKTKKIYIK